MSSSADTGPTTQAPFRAGPAMVIIAIAILLLMTGGAFLVGTQVDQDDADEPSKRSSVDVGFLQDMQVHHMQAVEMAVLVRDRTKDSDIRSLALDIELTQQQQIGQMYGLLASWGEPQSNSSPMAWMEPDDDGSDPHQMPGTDGMSGGEATMPGMASQADLDRLAGLRGRDAERVFLELMIAHHEGGIPMAEDAATNAEDPWVRTLATRIVEAQSAEIDALEAMLDERGGALE